MGGRPAARRGRPDRGSDELNLEEIAALRPDLIVGVYSFIDQATYDQLSAIAPTLAQTDEYADGATPWQEQTLLTGRALGVEDEAQQLVDDVEGRFSDAVAANPDFAGASVAVDLTGLGGSGHYLLGQDDLRTQFFSDLGFAVPETSTELSAERLDLLDADVLVERTATTRRRWTPTPWSPSSRGHRGPHRAAGPYSSAVSARSASVARCRCPTCSTSSSTAGRRGRRRPGHPVEQPQS